MRSRLLAALPFILVAACDSRLGEPEEPDGDEDAVATYEGGSIGIVEASHRLSRDRRSGNLHPECRDDGIESMVDCYRAIAADIALERILLDMSDPAPPGDLEQRLHEDLLMNEYLAGVLADVEIDEADIERFYEDNREEFVRPATIQLWNIFKRATSDDDLPAAMDELREARRRFLAGETFSALAREYSDSETRFRGGRVGAVVRGEMAPEIEQAAFSLDPAEVSEPIAVTGGAVLLHVSEKTPRVESPLETVSTGIRNTLWQSRVRSFTSQRAESLPESDSDHVLSESDFKAALAEGDRTARAFRIGEKTWTLGDLFGEPRLPSDSRRRSEALDQSWEQYRDIVDRARIRNWLRTSPDTAAAGVRDRVADEYAARIAARRADRWLAEAIEGAARARTEELRRFYQANRIRYTTPFSVELMVLSIPATDRAPTRLQRLEEFATRNPDSSRWSELAESMEGSVRSVGPMPFEDVDDHLPPKAATMISQADRNQIVGPFIHAGQLYLVRVGRRLEPELKPFSEAFERVVDDYASRFAESLAAEATQDILSRHRFRFDDEVLHRILVPEELVSES